MALTTTSELLTRLKQEVRDESTITATENRLLSRLNEAHLDIVGGGGILNDTSRGRQRSLPFIFPWALSATNIIVNTVAPIDTGTISVTQGSTSATLSATQATSTTGWYLRITGEPEVYRVSSHTGGTDAVTLDGAYVGTTDGTASYTLFKIDYDFQGSNMLLPAQGLINYYYDGPLSIINIDAFTSHNPFQHIDKGFPSVAGLVRQDAANDQITVRLNAYTENIERLELPYVPRPADLDTVSVNPIIPDGHRDIIVQLAAYKELSSRDDTMAQEKLSIAKQQFDALKAEARQYMNRQDANYGKIFGFDGGLDTVNSRSSHLDHPRNGRIIS